VLFARDGSALSISLLGVVDEYELVAHLPVAGGAAVAVVPAEVAFGRAGYGEWCRVW
jgi:hypothetical protein